MQKKLLQITMLGTALSIVVLTSAAFAIYSSKSVTVNTQLARAITITPNSVSFNSLNGGTSKTQSLTVALSTDFTNQSSATGVTYAIRKLVAPKAPEHREYCQTATNFPSVTNSNNFSVEEWNAFFNNAYFDKCNLSLCPFISIVKNGENAENGAVISGRPSNNQGAVNFLDAFTENLITNPTIASLLTEAKLGDLLDYGVESFNYPHSSAGTFDSLFAKGSLTLDTDETDQWTLSLDAPCFKSDTTCTARFKELFDRVPNALDNKPWGCSLWVEVQKINRPS